MAEPALDADLGDAEIDRRSEILDALGAALAKTRTEAIRNRESCGIENEWREDQEFYEGIDDANRGESAAWRSKPLGQADPPHKEVQGSTAFLNITRHYCDTGAARVGDMLLPTDDKGWAITPTPVPELEELAAGNVPERLQRQVEQGGLPAQGMPAEGMPAEPGLEPNPMSEAVSAETQQMIDQAADQVSRARSAAEKAEKRILDWHEECQFTTHMRAVIDDAAQLGTGVIKGPIATVQKAVAWVDGQIIVQEKLAPASQRVSVWNCYPDWPACGENIHNGSYHWERDTITEKQLRALKRQPGYLADQIDRCLQEGPTKAVGESHPHNEHWNWYGLTPKEGSRVYEIWYGYVTIKREDLDAAGADLPEEDDDRFDDVAIPAQVTLVNNRVIKAEMNLLDTGEFPYDYMVWSKRSGMPWGKGIARLIRTPQRMLNSAVRNMLDNAGIAGGPMIILKEGLVYPADGKMEIAPRKIWLAGEDEVLDDVNKAFGVIKIDMIQQELEAIVLLAMKMAEDVTGLPALMQGQQGSAPDTVGGMKILNDNMGSPMRRIARLFDDRVTEPHVRRYYAFWMQYAPPEDERGDFQITARGSSALVERDLNNMAIREMAQIVSDPTFGIDKRKWAKELLLSQRLDYDSFKFDDEQWEQILTTLAQQAQQNGQQQSDEAKLQIAQMKAEVDTYRAELQSQDKAADRELKIALAAQQQERDERDALLAEMIETIAAQLEMEKIQSGERQKFAEMKTRLAELVMKLREQRTLARMQAKTTQLTEPPTEPPQQAAPGRAFQE